MSKQKTTKTKLNKKLLTATVACVAATAVGVTGLAHVLQPAEVYAKESFTGTKQIVTAHTNADDPFLILDIVPSYATYAWQTTVSPDTTTGGDTTTEESTTDESTEAGGTGESSEGGTGGATSESTSTVNLEFSTGTLSYLVKGQSVMEKEYAEVYNAYPSQLKKYADRKAFVDAVWKSETDADNWGFRYEEAYAGTRKDLESEESISEKGWIKLIKKQTLSADDTDGATAHSGQMKGYYLKYESEGESSTETFTGESESSSGESTADRTGYDYKKVGSWGEISFAELQDAVYSFDSASGTFRLVFQPVDSTSASTEHPVSGYLMQSTTRLTGENAMNYSDATGVYILDQDSGRYFYVGTLGMNRDLFGNTGENGTDAMAPTSAASGSPGVTPSGSMSPSPSTDSEGDTTPSEVVRPTSTAAISGSPAPTPTEAADPVQTPASADPIPTPEESVSPTQTPTESNSAVSGTPDQSGGDEADENSTQITETASLSLQQSRQGVLGAVRSAEPTAEPTAEVQEDGSSDHTDHNAYYIVEFQYYDSVTDPDQKVYEIVDAQQLSSGAEEADKPYDAYLLESLPVSSEAETQGDIALLDEGAAEGESTSPPIFLYVGPGEGSYKLIDESDVSDEYKGTHSPVTMEVRNAPTYFRYTGGCDWLKESVFHSLEGGDNVNKDFKLEVKTIRADELTMDLIKQADLVYLEDGTAPFLNVTGTSGETAETETSASTATLHRIDRTNEIGADDQTGMTAENVYALAYRVVNDLLPVMADVSVIGQDELDGSNYQALVKLLLKKDPEGYVSEARTSTDWLLGHLNDADYPDQTKNGKYYVNHNIYMISGATRLVDGDFKDSFEVSVAESGFAEVLKLIRSENTLLTEENRITEAVSKARTIEYIINYAIGLVVEYRDLRILELQPSSNDRADLYGSEESGGTTLYIKRSETGAEEKQVLHSSSKMKVDVTVKSTSAFNSEWVDLNGTYNLIFIGLDGQKLNHSSDLWNTTKYNDTVLNGKLYHTGDKATGTEERYDGVDITVGKKQALLDFLRAGYPVLVENEFFTGKTAKGATKNEINTKYVADNTQLYQFLEEAVTRYNNQIYTLSDVRNDILFRAQTSLDRPVISLSTEAEGLLTSQKADSGEYYYTIPYGVKGRFADNYSAEYTVECYLDINGDGSFSAKERISDLSDPAVAEQQIRAVNNGGSVTVTFTEAPGSRAMSYLLRACDSNNPYLRSEVQGIMTFTDTTAETIRILQLGSPDDTSLAHLYQQAGSVLGYYLKEAEGSLNVRFEVTTMRAEASGEADATALVTRLTYDPNYLDQYDLLILGFGNDGNAELTGNVKSAVETYIADGRSVLVVKPGTVNNRLGLMAELLGQKDGKTYTKLGRDSGTALFRYAGLSTTMFTERGGLLAEGINAGSIYVYPNAVGKTGSFSSGTMLQAGDYLLDLTNDLTGTGDTYVTPWFVLTDYDTNVSAYNVSKHDGANNYYLYSKGNVVCIGQQDYAQYTYEAENEERLGGTGLLESQLFVNAMMLAYDAGVHAPKVDIVAGFGETAAQIESISVPFDVEMVSEESTESGLLDDAVDVYFRYKNSNLAVTKDAKVRFYYEDESGEKLFSTGDGIVKATEFLSEIHTVKDHVEVAVGASQLKQGEVYHIKAPVAALAKHAAATEARIYVEVTSTLQRPDGPKTVKGMDSVSLNRVQLFMLE